MIIRNAQFSFFSPERGKGKKEKTALIHFSSDPIDRIYRYKKHIEQKRALPVSYYPLRSDESTFLAEKEAPGRASNQREKQGKSGS